MAWVPIPGEHSALLRPSKGVHGGGGRLVSWSPHTLKSPFQGFPGPCSPSCLPHLRFSLCTCVWSPPLRHYPSPLHPPNDGTSLRGRIIFWLKLGKKNRAEKSLKLEYQSSVFLKLLFCPPHSHPRYLDPFLLFSLFCRLQIPLSPSFPKLPRENGKFLLLYYIDMFKSELLPSKWLQGLFLICLIKFPWQRTAFPWHETDWSQHTGKLQQSFLFWNSKFSFPDM